MLALAFGLFFNSGAELSGQTIFLFSLETNTTVTTDNAVGVPTMTVSGALNETFANAGFSGQCATYDTWDAGDYIRYTVNTSGYSGMNFSYYTRCSNTAVNNFKVRVSTDLSTWTDIIAAYVPSTSFVQESAALPAAFDNQAVVYIDVYKTDNAGSTARNMRIDEVLLTGTVSSPMSFVSCTSTQSVLASVAPGATSVQILGVQVVTAGATTPLTASSFTFTTNGSTAPADITNAKLWTTGTSSAFATTTQLGAVTVSPGGSFTITGGANMPYTLATGTNYFWLTYDVSASATVGDVLDAECNSVTVTTARTPTTQAPAGNRPITAAYCSSTSSSSLSYFNAFSTTGGITNITNNATGYSAAGYGDFTAQSASQMQNSSINFSTTLTGTTVGVNIWVDWNQDGDFADAGENVYASGSYVSAASGSFTVPMTASVGSTRMRIRMDYNSTTPAICGSISRGETEDYTFIVTAMPACSGTPTAGTATAGTASFTCSGSTTITLTGYTSATAITFQWQSSPAGANTWTNIGGATSTTFSTGTISASTDYRCVVTCGNSALSANSSTAAVTINANVPGSASASPASICSGSSSTISLTGATISGSTRQWQSSPDNSVWTDISGATGNTYTASPASATYYRCVITCTATATSLNSASVLLSMSPFSSCYCNSIPSYTGDEEIYSVTVNGSTRAYNCTTVAPGAGSILNRYSNFTSLAALTSIQQGTTVAFSISEDECDGATYYSNGCSIWIDFNQDGDFADAGEQVYLEPAVVQGPRTITGTIAVPITAVTGNTRMRIIVAESTSGSSLQPCMSYSYGETEDHLINITPAPACSGTPTAGTAIAGTSSFSCSGSTTITLSGSSSATGITYQWQSSPAGAGTWTNIASATGTTYSTGSLVSSTDYRCVVTCTNSVLSANSAVATVTINANVPGTASASAASVCPGSSTTISLTGQSIANSTLQWQSSLDNATWNNIAGATGNTYNASPSTAIYYRCVVTCTASATSLNSASVNVTINPPTACYCNSIPSGTGDEEIYSVTLNGSTRAYNCTTVAPGPGSILNRYSNFTSLAALTSIQQGATAAFSISEDECDGATYYSNGCAIWIDYNQDGDFTDAGEQVYVEGAILQGPRTISGNITIPINALTGNTRMRIIVAEDYSGASLLPCMSYSYGETEDHLINITAAPACSGAPVAGTAATDLSSFCNSGSPNLSLTGYTIALGIRFQWQTSSDNISWSNITGATAVTYSSPVISQTTYFRCEVRCGANLSYSNVLTVTKTSQSIVTTNSPVNITCNTTASLTATTTGGASVNWYAAASGGIALASGATYTTPSLSANTTYYCDANSGSTTESGGMPAKNNTYGSLTNGNGIVFDANQAFTLNSVTIYPKKSGNVTIAYRNSAGVQQAITGSIAVNGGNQGSAVVVPLGWAIPAGTGYRLVLIANSGITDLIYDYNTNYNYNSPSNALSVTDGWSSGGYTTSTNYYFYNLKITISCESTPRIPVNVVINSGVTAPVCSGSPSPANAAGSICPVATTISWAASNTACRAATSYLLYFGTDAAATNIINGVDIGNVLSYNLGTLSGSTQYYWKIVPVNFAGSAVGCTTWTFTTVGNPGSICPGLLGAGVINVASLPYASGPGTTAGAGNNLTSSNVVTCGSASYLTGEDQVFVFTPTTSGSIVIQLTSTGSYTGLMLYDGCPLSASVCGAPAGNCLASATSYTGNKTLTVCIVAGTTYYLILDSYSSPSSNPYSNLTISAPSGTLVPANDLPCNATSLTLGVLSNGDNSCAGSAAEPTRPTCWTSGVLNTVWYAVVAPASGQLSIKTYTNGLTDTQIGLYSGSCSSLTFVTNGCNDNISGCGSTSASQINMSGLTPGATYYLAIDGAYDLMGTFSVLAIDPATSTFPVTPGQDCTAAFPTCNSVLSTSDPGFANTGSVCDFTSANNCMGSGERSSVWYTIQIQNNGTLNFDIIPNDYSGLSAGNETDYDFIIWKTGGTGATSCAGITANAATGLVGCNYSSIGVTGIAAGGNAPAGFGSDFDDAYESSIPVLAGEQYTICVSNYTQSTSGFTIDYTTTTSSAINYTPSASILNWTGTSSTAWAATANWGSCNIPSCSVSAVIGALVPRMPSITANQNVNNLTINSGATLTIAAGVTLTVCGNFVNNGNLVMAPTATLFFNNTGTHQLSGNLSGTNGVGNILITQSAGGVNLTNALDIKGNFTTSNATSVLNTNGNYIRLAGNLVNASGDNTYTGTGTTGTLEFNGTGTQTYNQGSSQLNLNFVKMNHTGSGLTLQTSMFIKPAGTLNLTSGKIITNAFEVNVANTAPASVSTGNTSSYVQGNLRRAVTSLGSYDFPVGDAVKIFQRANIEFTAATSIGNLLARFDPWPAAAGYPPIQGGTECGTTYSLDAEDNGYWTITANANSGTGTYTTTLYPTNATNTATATAWTVMKQPTLAATGWLLDGVCSAASTASSVVRTGMTGFSVFGVAQSTGPLPVELLSFDAEYNGESVDVTWTTASEINNDYFTVERSRDAANFNSIGTVPSQSANGNSTVHLSYYLNDREVETGVYYYRLKQTDFNGTYKNSDVVSVTIDENGVFSIKPNPTAAITDIIYTCSGSENAIIKVFDNRGRLAVSKNILCNKGQNVTTIDLSEQPDGVFFVTLIANGKVYKTKLVKNK